MLCLCLVLCFGCFSFTANAEELTDHTYSVSYILQVGGEILYSTGVTAYPNNGEIETASKEGYLYYLENGTNIVSQFIVANDNGSALFLGGANSSIRLENAYGAFLFTNPDYSTIQKYFDHNMSTTYVWAQLTYTDGTTQSVNDVSYISKTGHLYDFSFSFTPEKDVSKVMFYIGTALSNADLYKYSVEANPYWGTHVTIHAGEKEDGNYYFSVDQDTKETTLLSGLLQWVTAIKGGLDLLGDSITIGFENIGNTLSDVWNSITALPEQIWGFIESGLQSLFVPDEETMSGFKDRFDQLLQDKFGAIYEVCSLITSFFDGIESADTTDTINIPETTINLPDDATFTFGGYDVKIVPDGFTVVVDALKLIIGISCTVAFVNGLRKRYDEVMGVEM